MVVPPRPQGTAGSTTTTAAMSTLPTSAWTLWGDLDQSTSRYGLSRYLTRSMPSPSDLYMLRKQFTLQTAASSFVTYCLFVSNRLPNRIHISRSSAKWQCRTSSPRSTPPPHSSSPPTLPRSDSRQPAELYRSLASKAYSLLPHGVGKDVNRTRPKPRGVPGDFVRDEINFWLQGAQRQAQAAAQANGGAPAPALVTEAPREVV